MKLELLFIVTLFGGHKKPNKNLLEQQKNSVKFEQNFNARNEMNLIGAP